MANTAILPPVIRVFLSSTFADMQNERNYFNAVLQPKLRAMCEARGVSFFSVDLRWGITKEEQIDGKVLPICLSEIDKCRPYFIGILGKRYGSVVHEITENMCKAIPWLAGKEGKSITELEMLYGVLDAPKDAQTPNCAFYLRDPALSDAFYPQPEPEPAALTRLKETIAADPAVPSEVYRSLEEFGGFILRDFAAWLDGQYPAASVAVDARKRWYNAEFRRNYIDQPEMRSFLDYYLAHDRRPLMLCGDGKRGKTAFLTNWALDRERCVLVNCRSDAAFSYWPSVAMEIVRGIRALLPDTPMPEFDAKASLLFGLFGKGMFSSAAGENAAGGSLYFVTDGERASFREGFVRWMASLAPELPVDIVINDLETLDDGEARLLTWLPAVLPENVRLICSCSDEELVYNAETLGWNKKEMPLFPAAGAEAYLSAYLRDFGKSLSPAQKADVLRSPLAGYPGYLKYIVQFLNGFGSFSLLPELTAAVGGIGEMTRMYGYSYGYLIAEFTEEERALFLRLLTLLRCNADALLEQDYYSLLSGETPVSALSWSRFRTVLEQLDVVRGEYWKIGDPDLNRFIDTMAPDLPSAQLALGRFYLRRLREENSLSRIESIRRGTENAKFALRHLKAAGDPGALLEGLTDDRVLFYLCKIDWHIVRGGWMHLVLYSDLDVPGLIRRAYDAHTVAEEDGAAIRRRLAGLLPDLEYRDSGYRFTDVFGQEIEGELHMHRDSDYSPAFVRVLEQILQLKEARQHSLLIRAAAAALKDHPEFTDREKTVLLTNKANSEIVLRLLRDSRETCAETYFSAIRTADLTLITDALMLYGHATYISERPAEARVILQRTKRFASLTGDLRTYLSASNAEGMCCYRMEKFDDSMELLRLCADTWKKVGNLREHAASVLNICNLYYLKGDLPEAIRIAEETLEALRASSSENARRLIPAFLGNIGRYRLENGDPAGEEILLRLIEEAEGTPGAEDPVNARVSLGMYYENKGLNMKAAEQFERMARYHFDRREYAETLTVLKRLFACLKRGLYEKRYEELYAVWEAAFSKIPNGTALFREQLFDAAADPVRTVGLQEQLVVARAEGDGQKEALLLLELAKQQAEADPEAALDYLKEAAAVYRRMGDMESCAEAALDGVRALMRTPPPDPPDLMYFQRLLPAEEASLVGDWQVLQGLSEGLAPDYPEEACEEYRELAEAVLASGCRRVLVCVLAQQLQWVLACCGAETVKALYDTAEETPFTKSVLRGAIYRVNTECFSDCNELRSKYTGPRAERLIRKTENLILMLEAGEFSDAPAVAGNIALIFRRRKDKEKTLRYHKLSMELFQAAGKDHDCLIEMLNLASAYRMFDMLPESVAQLREGLRKAHEVGDTVLEGALAGNLAGLLVEYPELASSEEEILELFRTEERIFFEAHEYRDYAISLHNQLKYLFGRPQPDLALIREKLDAATACAGEHHFTDIMSSLQRMEQLLQQMKDGGKGLNRSIKTENGRSAAGERTAAGPDTAPDADLIKKLRAILNGQNAAPPQETESPEAVLTRLVEAHGGYRIERWDSKTSASVRALCLPREETPGMRVSLYLTLARAQSAERFHMAVLYVMQPAARAENAEELMRRYTEWWNGTDGLYRLELQKKDLSVVASCTFREQTAPELMKSLGRIARLCAADALNLSLAASGTDDPERFRRTKQNAAEETG